MMLRVTPRMQPGGGAPYRTPAAGVRNSAGDAERDEGWPPYVRAVIWLLLVALAWIALLAWREHRAKAGILALPVPARQAVYAHAIDELRTLCPAQPELHDHCAEQAAFVLDFPDCDADCQTVANRALDHARR
jgi:hypothetical protein